MEQLVAAVILCLLSVSIDKGLCMSPPKFKVTPNWPDRTYYDQDGPAIRLDCMVGDDVNYTMIWTKNGNVIQPDIDQLLLFNGNQSLVFEDPKQAQSGLYRCLAYNNAGNVSHTGDILITARKQETQPRVIDTDPSTTVGRVPLGDAVVISCTFDVGGSAEALMDLTLNWYKDGVALTDTNHTTYGLNNTGTNDQVSSLTIDKLQKADYGTYKCYGENSKGNDSKMISVVPPVPTANGIPLPLIIGSSVGGLATIVTLVTVGIILRCRYTINKYGELEWVEPNNYDVPERKIEYDVFISYSSDDLDWVKDILFEKLCHHGYEVCIDFKDFTPGMAVAENIIDAVYKSHKTIVLLSENFLKSMWGQFELQQAHNRTILKRSDALVLIKYDNCKVPTKLMGKTFLDLSDVKVQPHFWTRLFEAIGQPGTFDDPVDDKNEEIAKTEKTETVEKLDERKNDVNESDTDKTEITGYKLENETEIDYAEIDEDMYDDRIEEYDEIYEPRVDISDKDFLVTVVADDDDLVMDATNVENNLGVNYKGDSEKIKVVSSVTAECNTGCDVVDNFQRDSVDMIDIHGKV